jgi:hypothetical protein
MEVGRISDGAFLKLVAIGNLLILLGQQVIIDGGQFKKATTNTYYKVQPQEMIRLHMPYDYLWQFFLIPLPILNSLQESCCLQQKKKVRLSRNKKLPKVAMQDEEQQLIAASKKEFKWYVE